MSAPEQLRNFIFQLQPLEADAWAAFANIWRPFSCRRKAVLTRSGETERYLYFVLEGVQRSFCVAPNGREATLVFTYPYSFSGIADSFLTQTPATCMLESLTASSFVRTDYQQLSVLMQQYPSIQALVLRLTAFALKGVLERQIELQSMSAEEKFRQLFRRSPHVFNLIPHKYLASYLGIDAATFSKLMGSQRMDDLPALHPVQR